MVAGCTIAISGSAEANVERIALATEAALAWVRTTNDMPIGWILHGLRGLIRVFEFGDPIVAAQRQLVDRSGHLYPGNLREFGHALLHEAPPDAVRILWRQIRDILRDDVRYFEPFLHLQYAEEA